MGYPSHTGITHFSYTPILKEKIKIKEPPMFSILSKKPLQLKSNYSIMESLQDFHITEDTKGMSIKGLTILDKSNIIQDNTSIYFKEPPKQISIFEHNEKNYTILKSLYPNNIIANIEININKQIILDMTSYESVTKTYHILEKQNHIPKSDKELIDLALTKMIPQIKLIKTQKNLGKQAFPNSKAYQYKLNHITCYDHSLILGITTIQ